MIILSYIIMSVCVIIVFGMFMLSFIDKKD